MVDALVRLMNKEGIVGPVNLGNPSEFTVLELADKVKKLTGSSSKILFKPLPPDDPAQRQPDISLAEKELGWKPYVALDDGLKATIEYFSSRAGKKKSPCAL